MKKYNLTILKIALLFVGFYLVYRVVKTLGIENLKNAMSGANLTYIALGLITYFLLISLRSLKWHILLKQISIDLPYHISWKVYIITSMVGAITPVKTGDLLAPILYKRLGDSKISSGLSIIIIDRLFELIFYLFLLMIGTYYFVTYSKLPPAFERVVIISDLLMLIIFMGVVAVFFGKSGVIKVIDIIGNKFRANIKISSFIDLTKDNLIHIYENFNILKSKKTLTKLIFFTAISWVLEIYAFFFILASCIDNLKVFDVLATQFISLAIGIFSMIPFGIGSIAISNIYLLKNLGYNEVQSGAGSLVATFLLGGSIIFYGLLSITLLKYHKRS